MIFVGIDWAEAHHDVCLLDGAGAVLATRRMPEGLTGVARLHALVAEHTDEPEDVVVGIETDRGLLVGALLAAGYLVYAVNPLAASSYRERHTTSRAKSDRGDAKVLAELVRTDRHHHRVLTPDSELLGAIKVLARAHQSLIWARQRQTNALRNALREYYPGALVAFARHPDAEILRSLPGLGDILGARVLAEFGDAPDRYAEARPRRNYAGTAPVTRASGTSHVVVARLVRNRRLFDACYAWAFSALRASPGARASYDAHDPGRARARPPGASWPTGSWASSMAASPTGRSMTRSWPGIGGSRSSPLDTSGTWGVWLRRNHRTARRPPPSGRAPVMWSPASAGR